MIWERWSKKHLEKEQMVNWRTLLISRNRFKIYAGSCSVCLATKQRTREFHSITLTPEQKGSRKAKHPRNASANKARSPPSLVASAVPRSRHSSLDARWLVFTLAIASPKRVGGFVDTIAATTDEAIRHPRDVQVWNAQSTGQGSVDLLPVQARPVLAVLVLLPHHATQQAHHGLTPEGLPVQLLRWARSLRGKQLQCMHWPSRRSAKYIFCTRAFLGFMKLQPLLKCWTGTMWALRRATGRSVLQLPAPDSK